MPVQVVFEDSGDGITLPKFKPGLDPLGIKDFEPRTMRFRWVTASYELSQIYDKRSLYFARFRYLSNCFDRPECSLRIHNEKTFRSARDERRGFGRVLFSHQSRPRQRRRNPQAIT